MQDLTFNEIRNLDDSALFEKTIEILKKHKGINKCVSSIYIQKSLPPSDTTQPIGFKKLDDVKDAVDNFRVGISFYLSKNKEQIKELCQKYQYCKKIREIEDKHDELTLVKTLSETLCTFLTGVPIVTLSWYIVKVKLLDDVCECKKV